MSFSLWPIRFILFGAIINSNCPLLGRRHWQPTPVLLPGKSHGWRSLVGCSPWSREESDPTERLHFHFHALEKEMATHSSVLAWRIPGMAEPGGLPSMGSHRVRHDWSNLAAAALYSSPVVYWTPSNLGGSSSSVIYFCLFILYIGFSRQEDRSWLPLPPPVDHILSGIFTMTRS